MNAPPDCKTTYIYVLFIHEGIPTKPFGIPCFIFVAVVAYTF